MSDGPHRSLNMHRSWKHLAERADNRAFSLDEVASAYVPALDRSCREEVPDGVWRELASILASRQRPLFAEQVLDQITSLRRQVAGLPLGCLLVEAVAQVSIKGNPTEEAFVDAATQALAQRAARGNRQVEEHYYRKSNERRTESLRRRLEGALQKTALATLARQHLNMGGAPEAPRLPKQSGLDDGVQLE